MASTNLDKTKEWIQGCLDRSNCWNFVMELLQSPDLEGTTPPLRVIGTIGAIRTPEVGYGIHPDYWGKGYASEALQAFMPFFWDQFSGEERYDHAEAYCHPDNIGSRRLLEKNGFTLVKIEEKDFNIPNVGPWNSCFYRIARPNLVETNINASSS